MMALSKIGKGGGMFLSSYNTDLLEYFVGKKGYDTNRKKHVEGFFGSYDS